MVVTKREKHSRLQRGEKEKEIRKRKSKKSIGAKREKLDKKKRERVDICYLLPYFDFQAFKKI